MPRTSIPVTTPTTSGVVLAAEQDGDTVNNHYLANSGRERLLVRNANGAATARTVTILFNKTVDGQAVTSRAVSIAAGATRVFGPFSTEDYGTQVFINVDNAELKLRAIA